MADFSPTLLGQQGLSGGDTANFLTVFTGMVLGEYDAALKTKGWDTVKRITTGYSHKFDYYGSATAQHHVRGEDTSDPANGYTDLIEVQEKLILVDRPILSTTILDEWDEDLNHWDAAPKFAGRLGRALAETRDDYLFRTAILGARASAILTTGNGGAEAVDADFATNGTSALASIMAMAVAMDEKSVPKDGRVIFVNPTAYYNLITAGSSDLVLISADHGAGSNGSVVDGRVAKAYGIEIAMSTRIPGTNVASNPTGANNTYSGDFSTTLAVGWQRDALATVERRGVMTRLLDKKSHLGSQIQAYATMGHGFLRPECCYEITSA